jgi:predicted lipoprotein with Yx(FWY)xxD motif
MIALGLALSLATPAFALSQAECEAKAVSKDGKPIYGAAKEASVKKCMGDGVSDSGCAAKALSKDGKPLYGAAKDSFIKKCEADAKK